MHELTVFTEWEQAPGVMRRLGLVKGIGYLSHIPPNRRRKDYRCPVGGELTRDYWYSHDTGKRGDVKLCSEHEVTVVARRL